MTELLTCFCSSTRAQSTLGPTSGGSAIFSYRARYSAHSWVTRSCSCLMLSRRWPAGQGWAWAFPRDPQPCRSPTHSFSISSACGCLSRRALSTSRKRSLSSTSASFRLRPVSCWCCRAWLCSLFSRSYGQGMGRLARAQTPTPLLPHHCGPEPHLWDPSYAGQPGGPRQAQGQAQDIREAGDKDTGEPSKEGSRVLSPTVC